MGYGVMPRVRAGILAANGAFFAGLLVLTWLDRRAAKECKARGPFAFISSRDVRPGVHSPSFRRAAKV